MNGGSDRPPDTEPDDSTPRSDKPQRSIVGWLSRHKLLATIAGGGFLIAVYMWLMGPSINPNPVQKITIRGQFPYSEGYDLVLQASFYSMNATCKQTARAFLFFAAADVDRQARLPIRVMREGGDRYSAELYLDHFSSGFCEWKYGGLSYQFRGDNLPAERFVAVGPVLDGNRPINMICKLARVQKSDRQYISCNKTVAPNFDQTLETSAQLNFFWNKEKP